MTMEPAKIAVIGTGNVGRALAEAWRRTGHSVVYGVRDSRTDPVHGELPRLGIAEAVKGADLVVPAVPWVAVPDVIAACGDLAGKVVMDVTNPLEFRDGRLQLALGFTTSGAEEVARLAPAAKVVKAMNQVGFEVMADCSGYEARPTMFVAGDDDGAKAWVLALVEAIGFGGLDSGPLISSRLLEPYAMLWISQVVGRGEPRDRAFAFQRRVPREMVVEYIRYRLTGHTPAQLLEAYEAAGRLLAEAPECLGYDLAQCADDEADFTLRIRWISAEGHLEGFRKGRHFPPFLELVRPFIGEIAEMRHYRPSRVQWVR
jgi:predicted dinucleotide-binding enzyme